MDEVPEIRLLDEGHVLALAILALVLCVSTFTELRENRIPNWITLLGVGVGLVIGYFPFGITLRASVSGLCVGFCFLFVFYIFGGMGGGDVKLMGAVGALLGFPKILPVITYTALVGGLMAILILIWRQDILGGLGRALAMLFRFRRAPATEGTAGDPDGETAEPPPGATVPYGLAIVCGCLLFLYLEGR